MYDIWNMWLDIRVEIYMLLVIAIFFLNNGTIRTHRKILEKHSEKLKTLEEKGML